MEADKKLKLFNVDMKINKQNLAIIVRKSVSSYANNEDTDQPGYLQSNQDFSCSMYYLGSTKQALISPQGCEADLPRCEKTGLRGFRPGLTHTRLYNYRSWLEA